MMGFLAAIALVCLLPQADLCAQAQFQGKELVPAKKQTTRDGITYRSLGVISFEKNELGQTVKTHRSQEEYRQHKAINPDPDMDREYVVEHAVRNYEVYLKNVQSLGREAQLCREQFDAIWKEID